MCSDTSLGKPLTWGLISLLQGQAVCIGGMQGASKICVLPLDMGIAPILGLPDIYGLIMLKKFGTHVLMKKGHMLFYGDSHFDS